MSILQAVSYEDLRSRGSIKDTDVLKLRRAFYEDGRISPEEADRLFELNMACPVQERSWSEFFIEAMTDYVVNQAEPDGYVTRENAEWLIARISSDGIVETKTELELLIAIIDRARWSPQCLVRFALSQVKAAVITGSGPIRSDKELKPGVIAEAEVELLRRILYAFGGDGSVAITRAEAELLFDIADATNEAENDAAWTDLFAKAIANAIMAASGYTPPSREEALRREAWLESRGDLSLGNVLGKMFSGGLSGTLAAFKQQSTEERGMARLERQRQQIITNEIVTEPEAEWLAARIMRDGRISETEKALLAFIKQESPRIHPALLPLLDDAA